MGGDNIFEKGGLWAMVIGAFGAIASSSLFNWMGKKQEAEKESIKNETSKNLLETEKPEEVEAKEISEDLKEEAKAAVLESKGEVAPAAKEKSTSEEISR